MPDWAAVRREFPALEHRTYLNTATFGQLPVRTTEAVQAHFERRDETACMDFLDWFDDADLIRASIARLIRCEAEDIAFVPNAATALGLLMAGIKWRTGDRIVTLKDEFPNNLYFPAWLAESGVEFIETPWEEFHRCLEAGAKLVLMSTVNYASGLRPPLPDVSRAVRNAGGLLYLDGTQSLGALQLSVADIQPDVLAVHGYKWLLSPNGAAFAYVSPKVRSWLQPNTLGWRSDRRWREVDNLHHGAPEFVATAEKYEGGMLAFPCVYAMGVSVDWFLELGPAAIESRVLELADQCRIILEGAGATIDYLGSPILAAKFPGSNASDLSRELRQRGVLTAARHGRLRVSVHFYNNEADLEALGEGLKRLL